MYVCVCVWGWGGGDGTIIVPYPLMVQARPPRDQRPAVVSRVSGQGCNDINVAAVYTAPQTSSYLKLCKCDLFTEIKSLNFIENYSRIGDMFIIGDFTSRSATRDDYQLRIDHAPCPGPDLPIGIVGHWSRAHGHLGAH